MGFRDMDEKFRFNSEILLLKQMDHPNILKLYEVYEDEARVYVVTEQCHGGELFDEIISRESFTEGDAAVIFK